MTTIYLADRDEADRKLLAHALQRCGVQVVEFASGPEVFARTIENEPDLVLLGTDLEEVDGFQVFVRLQRERPAKPYPVVFLTSFDHPGVARVCKHHGALDYLVKGDPLERVTNRIQCILAERGRPHERELPAALDWLQAQGKSGRLEVTAQGEDGHVLFYKGRMLEARWNFFEGDQALGVLREVPLGARFRFTEWSGETGAPQDADLPAAVEGAAVPIRLEVAPFLTTVEDTPVPIAVESAQVSTAVESAPLPTAVGSTLVPEEAEDPETGKPEGPVSRLALRGLLIALPLLLTVGWALAALFPAAFPGRDDIRSLFRVPVGARSTHEATVSAPRPAASSSDARTKEGLASISERLAGGVPVPSKAEVQGAPAPVSNETRSPITTTPRPPTAIAREDGEVPEAMPRAPRAASPATARKVQRSARLVQRSLLLEQDTDPPGLESQRGGNSVLLDIKLGTNGEAQRIEIKRSSGDDAVDRAAMAAARKVLWEPAPGERGAAGTWITLAVAFDPPRSDQRESSADSSQRALESSRSAADLSPESLPAEQVAIPSREPAHLESAGAPDPTLNLIYESSPDVRDGSRPSPKGLLRVPYPRELADKRVQGAATLGVLVGASGSVEDVRILRSSGHPELDGAIVEAVRGMSYHPARSRDGRAVPAWIEQQVLGVCCRAPVPSR